MVARVDALQVIINRAIDAQLAQQAAVHAPEEQQKQLNKETQRVLLQREERTQEAYRSELERVHEREGRNARRQEPGQQGMATADEAEPESETPPPRPPGGAPSQPLFDGVGGQVDIRV